MRKRLIRAAALSLALCLLIACAAAVGAAKPTATPHPGASRGQYPDHTHSFSEWTYYKNGSHRANCDSPGCTRWVRINCTPCRVEAAHGDYTVCPICGHVEGGAMSGTVLPAAISPEVRITHSEVLKWMGVPVVRIGQVDEDTVAVLLAYDVYGSAVRSEVNVDLKLYGSDAALLQGCRLQALAGTTEDDFRYSLENGTASFSLRMVNRPAVVLVFRRDQSEG